MGACPFCNGEIAEDLERFGGTCPHCFAEIPGEEAATDPGEEVKAQLRAEDERRRKFRSALPVFIATPIVLAVIVLVWINFRPPPVVEPLDFDGGELDFEIELAVFDSDAFHEERLAMKAAAAAAARRKGSRPKAAAVIASQEEPATPEPPQGGSAEAPKGDLLFAARRKAAILTDRGDIAAAFKDTFAARQRRLTSCFEDARKVSPKLAGDWQFSIVVDTEGRFTEVAVNGKQVANAPFEKCLEREVGSWRIDGRLEQPWPVSFPISFK